MLMAFRVDFTFPVAIELSDEEREAIVQQALAQAEEFDRAKNETFVFSFDWKPKV